MSTDLQDWEAVPEKVAAATRTTLNAVRKIRKAIQPLDAMPGYGYVFWHPEQRAAHIVLGDSDDQSTHNRWVNAIRAIGIQDIRSEAESHPADAKDWVLIKKAAPLEYLGNAWDMGTKALGGPNALATTIAGGLLAGGLGYGTGAVMEHLFPEDYVERGRLRKTLGLAGATVGAMPGIWQASANYRNLDGKGNVLQALLSHPDSIPIRPPTPPKAASDMFGHDSRNSAGGLDTPTIPVDAFNRMVWNDVRMGAARYNPYGTKDPWGDNSQGLHTPPAVGAATTGLMTGLSQMYESPVLTPRAVINGIASAGVGLAAAHLAGTALSALAGLTPKAQTALQHAGIFGGVLSAVVPPLFGR